MRRVLLLAVLAIAAGLTEATAAGPTPASKAGGYEAGATYTPVANPLSRGEALAAASLSATVQALAFQVVLPRYTAATFATVAQAALLKVLAKAVPGESRRQRAACSMHGGGSSGACPQRAASAMRACACPAQRSVKFSILGVEGDEDESASADVQAAFVSGSATPAELTARLLRNLTSLVPPALYAAPDGRVPIHLEGLSATYLTRASGAGVAAGAPGTQPALVFSVAPWGKPPTWFKAPQRLAFVAALKRASPGCSVTVTALTDPGYTAADGAAHAPKVVLNAAVVVASRIQASTLARKLAQGTVFPAAIFGTLHYEGPSVASLQTVAAGSPLAVQSISTTGSTAILTLIPPTVAGASPIRSFRAEATAAGLPTVLATSHTNILTLRGLKLGATYAVTVTAINGQGTGPGTTVKLSTISPPGAPLAPSLQGKTSLPGGKTQLLITPPASGPPPHKYKVTVMPATPASSSTRRLLAGGAWFTIPGSNAVTLPVGAIPPGGATAVIEGVDANGRPTTPPSNDTLYPLPRVGRSGLLLPGVAGVAAATLEGQQLSMVVQPPAMAPGAPPILSYLVEVEPRVNNANYFVQEFNASVTTYKFSPLTRNTTYTIFVHAVNKYGAGPSAPWDIEVPAEDDTVPKLLRVTTAVTSLVARGQLPPVGGLYASCVLTALDANGTTAGTATKDDPPASGNFSIQLTELQPGTSYSLSLVCYTSGGAPSPTSASVPARTLPP
eukprot:scaffold1.g5742.t1